METLETKLCIWKEVIFKDIEKKKEGNYIITFDDNSICYKCEGYNKSCQAYTTKER